jgi:hypothetical protein
MDFKKFAIYAIPGLLSVGFGMYLVVAEGANMPVKPTASKQNVNDMFGTELKDSSEKLTDKRLVYDRMHKTEQEEKEKLLKSQRSEDDFLGSDATEKPAENDAVKPSVVDRFNNVNGNDKSQKNTVEELPEPQKKPINPPSSGGGGGGSVQTYTYKAQPKKQVKKVEEIEEVAQETTPKRRSFYNAQSGNEKTGGTTSDLIKVVVHNDQTIKTGGIIRLRTVQDCIINGVSVPKNTSLSGTASFQAERVKVSITSLKVKSDILATSLSGFDNDGQEGIYVPGGINQKIANESAQKAMGGVKVNVPMVGTITLGGGQKKLAEPTVILPSNYKLTLKIVKD